MSTKRHSSLKTLAISGTAWTILGFGCSQLLRLASNLALSRLLVPEDFGIIAIVTVYLIALAMFSDIGIGPSVIHHQDGDKKKFLDTAWTVQIIRGGTLWGVCLLSAWPMSYFYHEPQLLAIIPVAGLASVISGFNSTRIFTANRNLNFAKFTAIELIAQLASLVLMIIAALIHPSVWVLVIGGLLAAAIKMILSHTWLDGIPNSFHWDVGIAKSLLHFGRGVFISTLLSFFLNSASTLILGKLVSMRELGVFSFGLSLAKIVELIYQRMGDRVLFPLYAKFKDAPIDDIRKKVLKIRLAIMGAFLPPLWIMVLYGKEIIALLFDHRYQGAGWILQVFSAGFIPMIISGLGPFYLSYGHSQILMKLSIVNFIFYLIAIIVGWLTKDVTGVILGMAGYKFLTYFAEAYIQHQYRIWHPKLDLIGFLASFAVLYSGYLLKGF